ncbi:MAG: DMT family transporter [Dorea sp.]|nr:DMT family transporter [Dorea sp.]
MEKNDKKSLLMLVTSMVIYGTIGIFRRYIPLSSAMLACYRGISGACFLILIAKLQRKSLRHGIGWGKVLGLVLTGAMIGVNWILLFEAYNCTTVATATLCYYMEPTIVVLCSPFFFKEKLTGRKLVCSIIAIVGMFFVSGMVDSGIPGAGELRGILCGLGAAAIYASVVMINKKLPGIDAYEKTAIQLASAGLVVVPYVLLTEDITQVSLDSRAILLLLVVGLVHTGIAYVLYFGSMDGLKAQSVALISYLDPVVALLLSPILLHESMTLFGLIGAIMILGAAVISELAE